MDTLDKINSLLEEKGKTQKALAMFIGIQASSLNKILKRDEKAKRKLSALQLLKASQYFGVSETYFSLGVDTKPVSLIPVVGSTSCGSPDLNHLQEGRTCYYNGDFYKDSLYCVIANGDSMAPDIEDGDEIICDPDEDAVNGDMVHYQINGESAVKIYIKDEEAYLIQFVPYNNSNTFKTKTVRLDDDEFQDLKISKVVAVNKLKINNRASRLRMIGRG